MAVTNVQNDSGSLISSLYANTGTGSTQALQDRFLTLLVTQLKNQDPLNPMENAELTSQLAQLSTVEEISKLNQSMTDFVSQFKVNQSLQAAGLVGRSVLAEGNSLQLGAEGGAGGVDLAEAADKVTVDILDADGNLVRTLELGKQPAGLARFVWDGLDKNGEAATEGLYSFAVKASKADEEVAATGYALAQVLSVTLNKTGAQVEVTQEGVLELDQIRQIY